MLFSLLKHYLEPCKTDTALKVSRSLYCFTTSISHGVESYFPRLWGTGISGAIFVELNILMHLCRTRRERVCLCYNVEVTADNISRNVDLNTPGFVLHVVDGCILIRGQNK